MILDLLLGIQAHIVDVFNNSKHLTAESKAKLASTLVSISAVIAQVKDNKT